MRATLQFEADIVIVGAGVAGGALATALARHGVPVIVLEKTLHYHDRAKGEFLVPWGVEEARKLGLLDVLLAAGGHYTPISVPYDENITPTLAHTRTFNLGNLLPGIKGAMTFGHPLLCETLAKTAQTNGATFLRGVTDIVATPENRPKLSFSFNGQRYFLRPQLVVGADGRGSALARQIRANINVAPQHHLIAGLLVDEAEEWPEREFCIGTEKDVVFYVLPQGHGRVRLYLCYGYDQRRRFVGQGKERRFLAAFRLSSIQNARILTSARPAGPCHSYPNADTWIDVPLAPGVVLIGDAAGQNDPTIGQGLAIAFRDARMVFESIASKRQLSVASFSEYAKERRERMRRLRIIAQLTSILRVEFTEGARVRRKRAFDKMAADPNLGIGLLAIYKGPFRFPQRAFEQDEWDRLLS